MNEMLKNPQQMTVHAGDGSFEYTPKTELGLLYIKLQNKLAGNGEKPHTLDEARTALEEERAGYDGLGKLWAK